MPRYFPLFLILALQWACSPIVKEEKEISSTLNQLFSDIEAFEKKADPFHTLSEGRHPLDFPAFTWEAVQQRGKQYQAYSDQLKAMDKTHLSRSEQISQATMLLKLSNNISQAKYKMALIPFNAEGGFFNSLFYHLDDLPFAQTADYQAYLKWLPKYGRYLQENQALMEQGINEGIVAPKIIVQNMLGMLEAYAEGNPVAHPLGQPFTQIPKGVNADLKKTGEKILQEQLIPIYQELLTFTKEKYLSAAPEEVGISQVPNGKAYYEDRVRYYTTLDLTPDSVYNLGLKEVKRIRQAMEAIIAEVKFKGSFADFLHFLRTDPQFYPSSAEELLNYAAWLSKKAEGKLPPYFNKLYSLPFTVEPVPDHIAPTYTAGRYVPGSRKQNRAGIYWVNTYQLSSRSLYTLPALTLHEAVPGHHLQIMMAAELEGIPEFRNDFYISAFGEGWALYTEYLGEEMGMYPSPYDQFGRYTYEMWRACRLVVDVGLHDKGWTRAEAVDYLAGNTALSTHEVNTEIDRYIGWPGQALSYKLGEIVIKDLRKTTEKALGDQFDIQAFHELILRNGSVPLPVLQEEVENYIQNFKAGKSL